MTLKHRLDQLRGQGGGRAAAPSAPGTLAERLRRSARRRAQARSTDPRRPSDQALAVRLEGEVLDAGVIVMERALPLDHWHGERPLAALQDAHARLPEVAGVELEGLVFMDTETTGLAGGSGTVAFLLGLARVQGQEFRVRQYLLSTFGGESAMLCDAARWLGGAAALVSFNGKTFDAPLLHTRCRMTGNPDPFQDLRHLDLLHPVRRAFSASWSDCRLVTAEEELLQFFRSNDLPGSEAPEAWFEWIHYGHAERLPAVARHNHWDLVSLAALLPLLGDVYAHPGEWGADVRSVARALLKRGQYRQARVLLEDHESKLDERGLLDLAWLYRREECWDEARVIWETLAEQDNADAQEWLAKYYEHQAKDYRRALVYAAKLPDLGPHLQRRRRLEDRLGQAG